ncbi:BSD domain-containing protein 1 isoform X2 [Bombina bombina]|uniref:BSD domain-containing protein 1 isoform X2 n=1 Tax=Bombina bombina TaxID=8345 RepID=UPI00235B27D3|nr:BSD domain-containing protein 1 isoform X2 [Bombina bombina]
MAEGAPKTCSVCVVPDLKALLQTTVEDGGWWKSWIQQSYNSVREKSAEALEFMKRDLSEFTRVVQHDTACTIAATASVVKEKLAVEGSSGTTEKMKKGISDIFGVISDTFAPSPDKTIDCDVITLMATPSGTTEPYDSTKARLYSLQSDPATYCNEPDGSPAQFDLWLTHWDHEERKAEISELLVTSPSIRSLYTKMVPAAVSHSEFWQRYFYKVHQLEQEEARRDALKQRAEQSVHSEEPGWDLEEEEMTELTSTPGLNLEETHRTAESVIPTLHVEVTSEEQDEQTREPPCATSPSESSESVSPVTQIFNPDYQSSATPIESSAIPVTGTQELLETKSQEISTQVSAEQSVSKIPARVVPQKEDPPSDLRVFELNSDSGKSTPSNNGQKGSSTDVSEDWEKDFDMTEEEVQQALSRVEISGEVEDEDWENWE